MLSDFGWQLLHSCGLGILLVPKFAVGLAVGKNVDALDMEKECNVLLADYDLSFLMGDTYRALGHRDSTLHYYDRVHEMCPSRLIPQYEMFRVYSEVNDTVRCLQLRKEILRKPIKVKSRETDDMLEEIRGIFLDILSSNVTI